MPIDAPPAASAPGATPNGKAPHHTLWYRLYHGETAIDFIGRTKTWFTISGVLILVSLIALFTRGLNYGIDFKGGVVWEVPAHNVSVSKAHDAIDGLGLTDAKIVTLTTKGEGTTLRIQAEALKDPAKERAREQQVADKLSQLTGADVDEVSITSVGASWGSEISRKAVKALIVFLIAITIYISIRFEWRMAIPTLAALLHDIVITVGIYALVGFPVTPATVVALLTILGYSIYDGIVVFDKVDENTRLVSSAGRMTYSDMVNLSLNQTMMRSLNTSITAMLPIASLLIIGSGLLGATTLEDFALALLIGLASGAYSSIFIASPLLAVLKEREPRYRDLRKRIEARGVRAAVTSPAMAASTGLVDIAAGDAPPAREKVPAGAGARSSSGPAKKASSPAHPPRPRKKRRR
jgi:preprotein translocase subunit SecF